MSSTRVVIVPDHAAQPRRHARHHGRDAWIETGHVRYGEDPDPASAHRHQRACTCTESAS
jgi:hypothetical protein